MRKPSVRDRAMIPIEGPTDIDTTEAFIRATERPVTGPGSMMVFMAKESAVFAENEVLKDKLTQFESSLLTKKIDPKLIRASKWANRFEDSFSSQSFLDLKSEIDSSAGNIQPIKVRPIQGVPESDDPLEPKYEIVFGHRRHRACLELNLPVLALIDPVSEMNLFIEMDRENRQRADLRPIEQGFMYKKALAEGLFPSMRKLCDSISVDQGNASRYIALANLPQEVIDAFEKPGDLQQLWASDLARAVSENADYVLDKARSIGQTTPRLPAKKVYEALISKGNIDTSSTSQKFKEEIAIQGKDGQTGKIKFNPEKRTLTVSFKNIDEARLDEFKKHFQSLIS